MSSRLTCLFLAVLLLAAPACWSGPWRLSRSWKDTTADWYSQNAWLHGALLGDVLGIYPIVWIILWIPDILILNPYYFWSHDAWTNEGTSLVHRQPSGPETVESPWGQHKGSGGWKPKK